MDRIDLFRIFIHVADCNSFTRTAQALDMPRSTVSTAIRQLERRVETRLLSRNTRRVALTRDGEIFYGRCQRLIADTEEVENIFKESAAAPTGHIGVSMPGRIGRLVVAPELPHFLEQYPGIDIELGVGDRAVNLIEQRLDCVVRVGTLPDSDLLARRIGTLRQINVASPAYLSRYGTPRTLSDLEKHTAVHYASPTTGHVGSWKWQDGQTIQSFPIKGRVAVNSAEAYLACCLAGLGLIQIPAYDVEQHLATGQLVEVLPDYRPNTLPMTLLYLQRRQITQRFHVFSNWLVDLLQRRCCDK